MAKNKTSIKYVKSRLGFTKSPDISQTVHVGDLALSTRGKNSLIFTKISSCRFKRKLIYNRSYFFPSSVAVSYGGNISLK